MDLIDRQRAIDALYGITAYHNRIPLFSAVFNIDKIPAVDAVEVVRCKDCAHYADGVCKLYSNNYLPMVEMDDEDFCSRGRREDG